MKKEIIPFGVEDGLFEKNNNEDYQLHPLAKQLILNEYIKHTTSNRNLKQYLHDTTGTISKPTNTIVKRIDKCRFSLMDNSSVKKNASLKIADTALYYRNEPKTKGLNDIRLGTTERRINCRTCGNDITVCPGHFGYFNLSYYVYHIGYIDFILKLLRNICFFCSSHIENETKKELLCPICNSPQPLYKKTGVLIKVIWKDNETKHSIDAQEIKEIFDCVEESVWEKQFGITKSTVDGLIIKKVCVPPTIIRPPLNQSELGKSRNQDDLTIKFSELLKKNLKTKNQKLKNKKLANDFKEKLQYAHSTIIDGDVNTSARNGAKKSIKLRIKGKEGRIRGNLSGKRVNFSARCVIIPDTYLDLDELGIPKSIAMTLTIPITVYSINYNEIKNWLKLGPNHPEGIKCIVRGDEIFYLNETNGLYFDLRLGDIVERYIRNGDWVVLNRQPSLHKMSMMAHRVRIVMGSTFRINPAVTTPYNADFDGDEMNLHVAQDVCSTAELFEIMAVSKQIVSPQKSKPVIGLIQDAVLGCYMLTKNGEYLSKGECQQLLYQIGVNETILTKLSNTEPAIVYPKVLFTGKQLISCFFPDDFNYTKEYSNKVPEKVLIINGQLIEGLLTKKNLGTETGSIIHALFLKYDCDYTAMFIAKVQNLAIQFLMKRGTTIGLNDCLTYCDSNQVRSMLQEICNNFNETLKEYTITDQDTIINEILQRNVYNSLLNVNKPKIGYDNLRNVIDCGSKGNEINWLQMTQSVGQQIVEGKVIKPKMDLPILPYFQANDNSRESQGLVLSSYANGLNPTEFWFHAMGGREGLVDTSVKTASIGYIHRRLQKSNENLIVDSDYSVINSQGHIVQYKYGGDCYDPTLLCNSFIPTISWSKKKMKQYFYFDFKFIWYITSVLRNSQLKNNKKIGNFQTPYHFTFVNPLIQWNFEQYKDPKLQESYFLLKSKIKSFPMVDKLYLLTCLIGGIITMNEETWKKIEYLHFHSLITNGEAVGSIATEAISEPATQMTLNSFHTSGRETKTVTVGIPRLQELIDATQKIKTPFTTMYFEEGTLESIALNFSNHLPQLLLKNILIGFSIGKNDNLLNKELSEFWNFIYEDVEEVSSIVLECNMKLLHKKSLLVSDVCATINNYFIEQCVKFIPVFKWTENIIILSIKLHTSESISYIRDEPTLSSIVNELINNVIICGVNGIENSFLRKIKITDYDERKGIIEKECFIIEAIGNNLKDCLNLPDIIWQKTYCNDIHEIYHLFGIEAAANVLFNELKTVMLSEGGYVSDQHLLLMIDSMTHTGVVRGMNRHGISKKETTPLCKISFEQTYETILNAALYNEEDYICGPTENILLGQIPLLGTGKVHLYPTKEYVDKTKQYLLEERDKFQKRLITCKAIKRKNEDDVNKNTIKKLKIHDKGESIFIPYSP